MVQGFSKETTCGARLHACCRGNLNAVPSSLDDITSASKGQAVDAKLRAATSEQPQVEALSIHTDKLWVPAPEKALTSRGTGGTMLRPQVDHEG
jgi:hypothetical protein